MANLFIPFEVRTALEDLRRRTERQVMSNQPIRAEDFLDLIEIVDNICNQTRVQDQSP